MKKAEEMFKKLGFRKNKSICYGKEQGIVLFEKWWGEHGALCTVVITPGKVKYAIDEYPAYMSIELIRAAMQVMKEYGWDGGEK